MSTVTRVIRILDHTGDSRFEITDAKSEAIAKKMFETALANRHMAMRMEVNEAGRKVGTSIKKFSQIGEETLVMPQLQGG